MTYDFLTFYTFLPAGSSKLSCRVSLMSWEGCAWGGYENGEVVTLGGVEDGEEEGIIEDCVAWEEAGREDDRCMDTKLLSVPWLL